MILQGKRITVHDMCLRDGMHPKRHRITLEQVKAEAFGLDAAVVPLIAVTHGDGLGGASATYGFPANADEEYRGVLTPRLKRAEVSALLPPGIGTVAHLKIAHERACTRLACPPTAPRPTSPSSTSPWPASSTWTLWAN